MLIAGHTQGDPDAPFVIDTPHTFHEMAQELSDAGYHVIITTEDPGNQDPANQFHCGHSKDEIIDAIRDIVDGAEGEVDLAMVGYSHGGGLVNEIADELFGGEFGDSGIFAGEGGAELDLVYTGNIDPIEQPATPADLPSPQDDRPESSDFHDQYWQDDDRFDPNPDSTDTNEDPRAREDRIDLDPDDGPDNVEHGDLTDPGNPIAETIADRIVDAIKSKMEGEEVDRDDFWDDVADYEADDDEEDEDNGGGEGETGGGEGEGETGGGEGETGGGEGEGETGGGEGETGGGEGETGGGEGETGDGEGETGDSEGETGGGTIGDGGTGTTGGGIIGGGSGGSGGSGGEGGSGGGDETGSGSSGGESGSGNDEPDMDDDGIPDDEDPDMDGDGIP
ncbi:MAG: hypothetical protein AAF743_08445, partial [Planctomycetota bacterium]